MGLAADGVDGECGRVAGADATGDCADVLTDVWRFLDDELDPERRAAVQRHLDGCSPCLEEAGIDTKLKALLARKCGGDRAPEQLRHRIVTRLVAWRDDEGGEALAVSTAPEITAPEIDVAHRGSRE